MARLRQQIEDFLTSMESFDDQWERVSQLRVSLERQMIVLEGLEVTADEAGTYLASTGSTKKVTSKELLEHAVKWADEADEISQGDNDTAPISANTTTSWESIALEDMDDTQKKGFFRRIWEAIAKVLRSIWRAIVNFFTGNKQAMVVLEKRLDKIESMLEGKHDATPKQSSLELEWSIAHYFVHADRKTENVQQMMNMLHHSEHVLAEVSKAYVKTIGHSLPDVKTQLKKSFEENFKNGKATDDFCLALATLDARHVADSIDGLSTGRPPSVVSVAVDFNDSEYEFKYTPTLVGQLVFVFKIFKSSFWNKLKDVQTANRIRTLCANSIVVGRVQAMDRMIVTLPIMSVSEIMRVVGMVRDSIRTAETNEESVKHYERLNENLMDVVHECIEEAEKHPEMYNETTVQLLSRVSISIADRLKPLVQLQHAVSGAASALSKLCISHAEMY